MMDLTLISTVFAGISLGMAGLFHIIGLMNERRGRRTMLETRQAELFLRIYDKNGDQLQQLSNEIVDEWSWYDFDDFMKKYGPKANPEAWRGMMQACALWEHLGLLVRDGLIEPGFVWHWVGRQPIRLWDKLEPIIKEFRERHETPPKGMTLEWFEDLVLTLLEAREHDVQRFPERQARRLQMREQRALPAPESSRSTP